MVLISGTQKIEGEAKTGKQKSEVPTIEEENNSIDLAKQKSELEVNDENVKKEEDGLIWQGTGDPLPQLLAVVPTLDHSSSPSMSKLITDEEYEEYDDFSDVRSIASDDSFYPPDLETHGYWQHSEENEEGGQFTNGELDSDSYNSLESLASPEPLTLFKACNSNNVIILKALMRQGLTKEEVCETDKNNRTGLLVACYQGYVDIVIALSQCPHVDVNWQDNDGNTALITAAQAGHITITNYLLNYYPDLNLEKRNIHGFTALMKASIQGRTDCVRALMLAGADIQAVDPNRGLTSREWARFTGRYDTAYLMQRLIDKPSPEQFSNQFQMEWPKMKELLAKAAEPKSCAQKISECIKSAFTFNYFSQPEEDGVLDHMVKITTSINSPFVAVSCRTVCPDSPPCVGKRRYSVQEIMRKKGANKCRALDEKSHEKLFHNSTVTVISKKKERRASLQPHSLQRTDVMAIRRTSLLPLNILRRSSVRPGYIIPKVRITKAPTPTYYPDKARKDKDNTYLQIPKWRYKELKEERKKAEEEALRKRQEAEKEKQKKIIKKKSFT
ncbi:ankyrin repeat domain-containing protein 33B [Hyla sarda]|uniref:ankyrin repeat domain-containing protein 33B n=1 Tax=Hyla sarda TaxID=327740 RepID=UPI0024C2B61D|nr:ankyrin repeat domain-containing protein 33B [Hyla sarda]XP_056376117.1 ankyrin repeat domain-containing protein 33B [Hyla sarda]